MRAEDVYISLTFTIFEPQCQKLETQSVLFVFAKCSLGQTREIKLRTRYEKPTVKRHRLQYERAQRVYNENMKGKIALLMKGQRDEYPWS